MAGELLQLLAEEGIQATIEPVAGHFRAALHGRDGLLRVELLGAADYDAAEAWLAAQVPVIHPNDSGARALNMQGTLC